MILGTWAIGGFQWGGTSESDAVAAILAALDEGINAIDTAPVYGFGDAERFVGRALKGRRDKVIVATKCGLVWHVEHGRFFFAAETPEAGLRKIYRYLDPRSIRYEIEQSLTRLSTEYIDLYQVHWVEEDTTPVHEVMGVLMELKKEGKIRAIGVSNATVAYMDQYRAAGCVDSDQERYSIFDRKVETANIRYCARHKMAFLAYSPLFHGLLSGKVSPEVRFAEDDMRRTRQRFAPEYISRVNRMLAEVLPLARQHNATIAQLILAYMLHQPGCTHVLVGARKTTHAVENARAADIVLASEELDRINTVFSRHMPGLELPPKDKS